MHNKPHTELSRKKMSAARKGKPLAAKRRASKIVGGITLWQCGKCKNFLPYDGFYKNKRTLLGIKSECRECHTKISMLSRNKENHADINRGYARRAREKDVEKFRQREKAASRARPKTEKTIARAKLNAAVRDGRIARPAECQQCKKKARVTGHHHDYSRPLDVEWLCYECHGLKHRKDANQST